MSFLFNLPDAGANNAVATGAPQPDLAAAPGAVVEVAVHGGVAVPAAVDPASPSPPATPVPDRSRPVAGRANLGLAVIALALALIGEFYFKTFKYVLDGAVFFGAAIVVFLALVREGEAQPRGEASPSLLQRALAGLRNNPVRAALILLSLVLAYTSVRVLRVKAGNTQYWDVFWVWAASFVSYALAFARLPRFQVRAWWRAHGLEVALVLGLTLVAAALRFVKLGQTPNIISGDEGRLGVLAQAVLNGELNNMMATVFGNSTLYLYIVAAIIKVFGTADATTLRITSALSGTLTVPVVYLFARRFFNWRVALVAACLLTVSHFHLHFSRIVVAGGIQDALFATVAFYFFLSGLEKRSSTRFMLSGLVMGLHIYIYMGARLVILFMPFYIVALVITNPKLVRDNLGNLLVFAGMLVVVVAPMGLFAIQHPDDFNARANQIGVIQSGWLDQEAIKLNQSKLQILLTLFVQALLTVNFYPAVAFYNSTVPILDFVTGAIFVLGLAYSLTHVTDRRHLLLNGWFWSAIVVGGALVVLPATSAYRILIMLPAICIFVGLAWDRLVERGFKMPTFPWLGPLVATVAFVLVFSVLNLRAYFVDYAPSCRYEDWGTRFASYMGEALGKAGPGYKAYLLGYPRIWYGIHPSVDYLSGKIPISDIKQPLTAATPFQSVGGKAIFFFTPEREKELEWVKRAMPGGEVRRILDCEELMLTIYQVGGAQGQ